MAARLALAVPLVVVAGWSGLDDPAAARGRPEVVPVTLAADETDDDFGVDLLAVIDDLGPSAVLEVRVSGFPELSRVGAVQCVHVSVRSCGNRLPVQTDESGRATFQYLVVDDFSDVAVDAGRCSPDRNRCTVRVQTADASDVAEIETVFNGPARPEARITASPQRELVDGSTVTVSVGGYPPGATFDAVLCHGSREPGPQVCGAPGPSAPISIRPDGTGTTTMTITPGPVGASRSPCTRRTQCGVTLVSADTHVRAAPVSITFAGRAGPEYERGRLVLGLGTAALLLGLALWWMVTGEWGPPQEADASALENAEYADLDAMVAEQDARARATEVSPAGD